MNLDIDKILQRVSDTVEFGDVENVGVNTRGMFHNTPMHVVISWNDPLALKVLMENGADVNARGERGFTPLLHAIMMKNANAVDALISNGADPTIKNDDADDAFSLARKVGDLDIIGRMAGSARPSIN